MVPDNLTEEDAKELINDMYDFMHYRASNTRFVIFCFGVLLLCVIIALLVWLIMWGGIDEYTGAY